MIPERGHLYVCYAPTNFRNPMTANRFLCLHIMAVRRGWMEMEITAACSQDGLCWSGCVSYSHSQHLARYDDGSVDTGMR